MNLLILKSFNNYFNRKIKKYTDLQDYIDNSTNYYDFANINFNPNDGVATSQIIGSENQKEIGGPEPEPLKWETEGSPDYLIAYTQETIDETTVTTIHSRWFVLESVRTRNGQYQLALKRDIIADKLEQILTNPCFVEKGYVKTDNPLIFNDEGVSFNEIKNYKNEHPEILLKDATGIPWLILYVDKNTPASNTQVYGQKVTDIQDALDYDDLPWAGLESSSYLSEGVTRRIPGAAGICISPITTGIDGTYDILPYRTYLRYYYPSGVNDWVLNRDQTQSYIEAIGSTTGFSDGKKHLKRGDINLTPTNNNIRNNDDGAKVPAYLSSKGYYIGQQGTRGIPFWGSEVIARKILETADLTTTNNSATNVAAIKSYLNTKKTLFESYTRTQSSITTDGKRAYVGGPQIFKSSSTLLWYNNKIVTSDYINYYRIKITRANNYRRRDYGMDRFVLDGSNDIQNSATNNLGQYLIRSTDIPNYSPTGGTPVHTPSNGSRNSSNSMVEAWIDQAWFDVTYELIVKNELNTAIYSMQIPAKDSADRISLNDAAYDMIALPYGEIDFHVMKGSTELSRKSSAEVSICIARAIAASFGDGFYDMQLLPYCPWQGAVNDYVENGYINITGSGAGNQTLPIGCWFGVYEVPDTSTPVTDFDREHTESFGLWCPQSHGSFNIEQVMEIPTNDSELYKIYSSCKKFRLVSPNFTSMFEFNPLKNNGVTQFNVDYNYKPYNSYIHIAPVFSHLYGDDTNDQRGLILQGDFSVGYWSDKWAEYQLNNVNYNDIFNRQIQNMDVNQRIEREKLGYKNVLSFFGGTTGGAVSGALTGAKAGPYGAIAGGIVGGIVGGVGAGVGAALNEKWLSESQTEARSYATDMYELNLGNIKAQPYGLAKSDALTENFKYFPFIEEYDCTDKEVDIFKLKLKYDGMTVNAIGSIQDYLPEEGPDWDFQRIKGRMIMLDSIVDDFHIADAIYQEIDKGFYLINQYEDEGE